MNFDQTTAEEQKLNRLANIATYHQAIWLLLLFLIIVVKPQYYKDTGKCLGMLALLCSFIASRIYIHAGKKVEKLKKFSAEEVEERKKEYLYRFFCPYFLWAGCVAIFSL